MTSTETSRVRNGRSKANYSHKKHQKYLKVKADVPVITILFAVNNVREHKIIGHNFVLGKVPFRIPAGYRIFI
jgi:hypothetical protein